MLAPLDTAGRLIEALSAVHTLAVENRETLARVDVHVSIGRRGIAVDIVGDAPFEVRRRVVDTLAASVKARPPRTLGASYLAENRRWMVSTAVPSRCPNCGGER